MTVISDTQINMYIQEKKVLPAGFSSSPPLKQRGRGEQYHFEQEVRGVTGNIYKIIIRVSLVNPSDFSIIFGILLNGALFIIRRYNGDSHIHTNKIEGIEVEGYHIHKASEKYQEKGFRPEGYAEKTVNYSNWRTALDVMLNENNFIVNWQNTARVAGG